MIFYLNRLLLGVICNRICLFTLIGFMTGTQITLAQLSGHFLNYNGIRFEQPDQLFVGRTSIRTNLTKQWDQIKLHGSVDLQHPYYAQFDSVHLSVRELYLDLYSDRVDLRIGQQNIARGRTYGTLLTDNISPLDLSEFLTRDLTELRRGLPAVVARLSLGAHQLEGLVNPIPVKTRLPDRGTAWDFMSQSEWPVPITTLEYDPPVQFSSVQWGLQFNWRPRSDVSLDLGAQLWRHPLPAYQKVLRSDALGLRLELTERYKRTPVISASGDMVLRDGFVIVSEFIHYASRYVDKKTPDLAQLPPALFQGTLPPDQTAQLLLRLQDADGYLMLRPFSMGMLGATYSSGSTFVSLQANSEFIWRHTAEMSSPQHNAGATLLIRNEWLQGTWLASVFSRYGFTHNDYWIQPELQWKPRDPLQIALGSHVFGGSKAGPTSGFSFAQYQANSFLYLRLAHRW